MDGFDEKPGSFDAFYAKNKTKFKSNSKYTVIIGIGVLIALFAITNLISNQTIDSKENDEILALAQNEDNSLPDALPPISKDDKELEVLPEEIEQMEVILKKEQVTAKKIVTDQKEQQEKREEAIITIDEEPQTESEFGSEKEDIAWSNKGLNIPPTLYIYDLSVVDYRKIKRDRESITYKRFELGGISADQESENNSSQMVETEVEIPYTIYLQKSMSFFAEQQYKQALNRYLTILEQYPSDLNALFYGGLSYYNLGKYEKSITFFNKIQASEYYMFNEESLWYKAKALVQLNKKDEADLVLNKIIIRGGFYTKDAIHLKAEL